MALSIAELELQTAEFLPAREVMTSYCGKPKDNHDCGCDNGSDDDTWQQNNNYQKGLVNVGGVQVNNDDSFNDNKIGLFV